MFVSAQVGQEKICVKVDVLPVPKLAQALFTTKHKGIPCVVCKGKTAVIDSRQNKEGTSIRRRRICGLGHRFTTHETIKEERTWEHKTKEA